jgi:hypothetical protein
MAESSGTTKLAFYSSVKCLKFLDIQTIRIGLKCWIRIHIETNRSTTQEKKMFFYEGSKKSGYGKW